MQQGTRYGTTTHSRKVVQDSDAYTRRQDGEIKEARRSNRKLIGMAWVLACRSVGARAAPCIFTNAIKGVYGTVHALDCSEALP